MPSAHLLYKQYSSEKLCDIGRQLYREARHEEALEAFSAAIRASSGLDCALLDSRAATYEKLNNLPAALKDARNIIEHDKGYVNGYLRTGKILRKMEKHDLALKIYERGVRLCKPDGSPHYQALREQTRKLSAILSPGSMADLLTALPVELIEMIMSYLPFPSLCRCAMVCRAWRQFLTSIPSLWTCIDLSKARKPVRRNAVMTYLGYSQGRAREAFLRNLPIQATSTLEQFVRGCKNLERLTVGSGGELSNSLLKAVGRASNLTSLKLLGDVMITDETAKSLLKTCPRLVEVNLGTITKTIANADPEGGVPCSQLESLTLHYASRNHASIFFPTSIALPSEKLRTVRITASCTWGIEPLLQRAPRLTSLELDGTWHATLDLVSLTALPRSLEVLRLHRTSMGKGDQQGDSLFARVLRHEEATSRVGRFPALTDLLITELYPGTCPYLVHEILHESSKDASQVSKVSSLEISVTTFTDEELISLLVEPRLSGLERMSLHDATTFQDRHAEILIKQMKRMRKIRLAHSRLTGVGVKTMVQGLPLLQSLHLGDCAAISPDAIEWARSNNILVILEST